MGNRVEDLSGVFFLFMRNYGGEQDYRKVFQYIRTLLYVETYTSSVSLTVFNI